jgi:hypothetical protein
MGASHVLKGNQRAGGNNLATHLMNEFDNEHRGKMYGCIFTWETDTEGLA